MRHRSPLAAIAVAGLAVATMAGLLVGGLGGTAAAAAAKAPAATAATTGTAGCGKAPTLASGTHTIQSSGQTRSYILRVPANYDSNHPYRLIFGFHWLGGTANDVDSGGTTGTTGPTTGSGAWRTVRATARSSSRPRASTTAGPTPAART